MNHTASDFTAKRVESEVAAAASTIPDDPRDESSFAKARSAAIAASDACEAIAHGDTDKAFQRIEATIRSFQEVLADHGLDLLEVLPTTICARCEILSADVRTRDDGQVCAACDQVAFDEATRAGAATRRSAAKLLHEAEAIIRERGKSYGDAEKSFARVAAMWSIIVERTVYPHEVATMLATLKICRTIESPGHRDSYLDGSAYLALAHEVSPQKVG